MATLTTSWQMLSEKYLGNSYGNVYVRVYAKYSEQDIANNRSYVYYQNRVYFSGNWIEDRQSTGSVSGTGLSTVNGSRSARYENGETPFCTTEGWINHDSNGKKSISASAYLSFPNWGWSGTASGSADLPTIPREAKITSAPNFNDEENPTINYNNSAGNSVNSLQACISLTGESADIAYRDISKTGTSYTFELTEDERNVLRYASRNSNTLDIMFFVRTEISGNTFYSYVTRKLTIVNANPIFEDYTYEDINPKSLAVTHNSRILIKNVSHLQVNISSDNKMQTLKSATPISYSATMGNAIANQNYSDNDLTIDVGTIPIAGSQQLKVTAIDSRSNDTTISKNVTVLDYQALTFSESMRRVEPTTGEVKVSFSGYFFNHNILDNPNSLTIEYDYRQKGEENYSGVRHQITDITFNDNNTYEGEVILSEIFDYRNQYEFVFYVSDLLTDLTAQDSITRGYPIFWWGESDVHFLGNIFVGGSPIIESGENENGSWVKWADGTMICRNRKEVSFPPTSHSFGNNGYLYYNYVDNPFPDFPEEFTSVPSVTFTVHTVSDYITVQPYPLAGESELRVGTSRTNAGGFYGISATNANDTIDFVVDYIAIGRWKELESEVDINED